MADGGEQCKNLLATSDLQFCARFVHFFALLAGEVKGCLTIMIEKTRERYVEACSKRQTMIWTRTETIINNACCRN